MLALALPQQPASAEVRTWLEHETATSGIPGLSAAVVKSGAVVLELGVGRARTDGAAAAPETVYPLYSVSKLLGAVAVMQCVEEKKLALDAPVETLLPALPKELAGLTLRQVLSHTSGLRNFFDAPEWKELAPAQQAALGARDVLEIVAGMPRAFPAGTQFSYTQSGYVLAGALLEHALAQPFAAAVEQRLFAPLALSSCRYGDLAAVGGAHAAETYERVDGALHAHAVHFETFVYPAAGLNASVHDLALFACALQHEQLLTRAGWNELWKESVSTAGKPLGYGLGWAVDALDGHRRVGHEGGGAAWFWHFPAEQLTVIVLTNLNGGRNDVLVDALARRYL